MTDIDQWLNESTNTNNHINDGFYTCVRQYGKDILYVGYNREGKRVYKKDQYAPKLYTHSNRPNMASGYKTYNNEPLQEHSFNDIQDAKQFIRSYSGVENVKLYGNALFNCAYIAEHFHGEIDYDLSKIKISILDIEVYSGNGFPDPHDAVEEITLVQLKERWNNTIHVWTCNKWGVFDSTNLKYIDKEDQNFKLIHHDFDDEKSLLLHFISYYSDNYPDILTGWYSRHFDVPYMFNRLKRVLGSTSAKKLSPFNIVMKKEKHTYRFGVEKLERTYDIYGYAELDYQDLYKKYTYAKEPSYSLDAITKKHLKRGKVEYDGSITDMLLNNYQQYCEYGIIDVHRIDQLEDELQFLDLIIDVSYSGKVPDYAISLGTVKYWEILIYNYLYSENILPEVKEYGNDNDDDKDDKFDGAYVKEPIPGLYKHVVSFDFESLYPKLYIQCNIGAETKVGRIPLDHMEFVEGSIDVAEIIDQFGDVSVTGNGTLFSKEKQSFFSKLMEKFFNKRKEFKKLMFEYEHKYKETGDKKYYHLMKVYHIKQLATKILINSFYGGTGNKHFQYFDLDCAEAITLTGQTFIKIAEKRINEYLNSILKTDNVDYTVAMDTDSCYITLDTLVEQLNIPADKVTDSLDKICKNKLEPKFKEIFTQTFKDMNHYRDVMVMKREAISEKALWTGKKRYAMVVNDNEGVRYDPYKLKVMGLEVVKSSTPMIVRKKLERAIEIILTGNEDQLRTFVSEFRTEFKKLPPSEIAFPRGTNEIDKWKCSRKTYKSGCPIHIRGAILYNNYMKKTNYYDGKYDIIKEGDGLLFTYMITPNPFEENVFAFIHKFPKETGLEKYIDYDTQFEKTFLDPLTAMTNIIGWKVSQDNNIMGMFM